MSKKRKIAVILNPAAGNGKTINALPDIKNFFEAYNNEIEPRYLISGYKGDVTAKAKACYNDEYREFVVIGGDGTVSELLNGFYEVLKKENIPEEDQIKIAIIPLGTGNDFARVINGKKKIPDILKNLIEKKGRKIDVGMVNEFIFFNVCSFGIDGPIIHGMEKYKKIIPGKMSYLFSTLKSGMTFKAGRVQVTIDDVDFLERMILIAVGNGRYIGGGMNVCPTAELSDGKFEICLVENVNRLKFSKEIGKIYSGQLGQIKEVTYKKGKKIQIETLDEPYYINADGNIVGKTPATIRILPERIFVYGNF